MEKFLELNSEFLEEYKFLQKVLKKVFFQSNPSLESYLSSVKLDVFKLLMKKNLYSSEKLKKTYKEIIKEEANAVEKMIFKIILNEQIAFDDINLKFLFYKEFPEKRHLFSNATTDYRFEVADLIFRLIYLKAENNSEEILGRLQIVIKELPMQTIVFYFLLLKNILSVSFMRGILLSIKQTYFLEYWIIGITCLSESEFYNILSSELLNCDFVKKIRIVRVAEDIVDKGMLFDSLLSEAIRNILTVKKMYINFLNLLELFNLNFELRISYLTHWIRYFIYENFRAEFDELLEKLDRNIKEDNLKFFNLIKKYYNNDISYEKLKKDVETLNDCSLDSKYTFKCIVTKIKDY